MEQTKQYKKIYMTKYEKELKKNSLDLDAIRFIDEAFYFYLDHQINKAK